MPHSEEENVVHPDLGPILDVGTSPMLAPQFATHSGPPGRAVPEFGTDAHGQMEYTTSYSLRQSVPHAPPPRAKEKPTPGTASAEGKIIYPTTLQRPLIRAGWQRVRGPALGAQIDKGNVYGGFHHALHKVDLPYLAPRGT